MKKPVKNLQPSNKNPANPPERWRRSGLFVGSVLLDWVEACGSKRG